MIGRLNIALEKYIGKQIEELIQFGDIDKTFNKIDLLPNQNNYRILDLKSVEEFCGMSFNRLQITLDGNRIVQELSTAFPVIIDWLFYDKMIKCYGYPNTIQVIDKLIKEKKTENNIEYNGGFNQSLKKRFVTTKEGEFENKPIFILWKKENYDIKLMFYYKENATQLTFRKPKADLF